MVYFCYGVWNKKCTSKSIRVKNFTFFSKKIAFYCNDLKLCKRNTFKNLSIFENNDHCLSNRTTPYNILCIFIEVSWSRRAGPTGWPAGTAWRLDECCRTRAEFVSRKRVWPLSGGTYVPIIHICICICFRESFSVYHIYMYIWQFSRKKIVNLSTSRILYRKLHVKTLYLIELERTFFNRQVQK